MSKQKYLGISIIMICIACVAVFYHLVPVPRFPALEVKPSHFVIIVEDKIITVWINGEKQIRYTPYDSDKDNYSIGFFYPPPSD